MSLRFGAAAGTGAGTGARAALTIAIDDPEVAAELDRFADPLEREAFAARALRIGVIALKQARGAIDHEALRAEGEHLVASIRDLLRERGEALQQGIQATLRTYFDPATGQLEQRLRQLVARDGELERLFARHVGPDESQLARTLAQHLGRESPLLKMLSPEQKGGFVDRLASTIEDLLRRQRDAIVREFSLDEPQSALNRCLAKLELSNETLARRFAESSSALLAQFSLDREDTALSRLVRQVDLAQKKIAQELTLDREEAALFRLRRELHAHMHEIAAKNASFYAEIRAVVESLGARKAEMARSTRHGVVFEEAVGALLVAEAQAAGDVFEHVGTRPGAIPRSLVGDFTVVLGPESHAPGARIVVEAKAKEGTSLADALAECETARKNRGAEVAVFVFAARTAPPGLAPLKRYGATVVVRWDAEDETTDVWLKAALSVARAIAARAAPALAGEVAADLAEIERAVHALEKEAERYDAIRTSAETIQRGAEKVIAEAQRGRKAIEREVEKLRDALRGVGAALARRP